MSQIVELSNHARKVLEAIKKGDRYYGDIMATTGFDRPQIRRICGELKEKGLIVAGDYNSIKIKESK